MFRGISTVRRAVAPSCNGYATLRVSTVLNSCYQQLRLTRAMMAMSQIRIFKSKTSTRQSAAEIDLRTPSGKTLRY